MGPSIASKPKKRTFYDKVRLRSNLYPAWQKVYANGIRSQSAETRNAVKEFSVESRKHIEKIYRELLYNKFVFRPGQGIPIHRPQKSPRPIVIQPVENRIVQRSILDVLQKEDSIKKYADTPYSFGGLENKNVPKAVKTAHGKIKDGAKWYIQSDIKNFFSNIPKPKIIKIISNFIKDEKFINLFSEAIKLELKNMAELGGKAHLFPLHEIGVAQGCCLSPLIGNILLHDFDKMMNGNGVYCLRYIDDFIILAPTRKKAIAAFRNGSKRLKDDGLDAYDPEKESAKARLGKTDDGLDFLGCEIKEEVIRPNKKSRDRLLERIDKTIKESKDWMSHPAECYEGKRSFVETLKSINNLLVGWGNQYSFCNDRREMENLDKMINSRLSNYLDFYKKHLNKCGDKDFLNKRRLLGVHPLIDSLNC